MRAHRSWRDKLADSKDLPRIELISDEASGHWGTGTVVIPAPHEVNALMRRVPRGKLTTVNGIREALARRPPSVCGSPYRRGRSACAAVWGTHRPDGESLKSRETWYTDASVCGDYRRRQRHSEERASLLRHVAADTLKRSRRKSWLKAK